MNSTNFQNEILICLTHASKRTVTSSTEKGKRKLLENLIRKKKYKVHYNEVVMKGEKCKQVS